MQWGDLRLCAGATKPPAGAQHTTGREVNRMLHICQTPQDLINKLEAVR